MFSAFQYLTMVAVRHMVCCCPVKEECHGWDVMDGLEIKIPLFHCSSKGICHFPVLMVKV